MENHSKRKSWVSLFVVSLLLFGVGKVRGASTQSTTSPELQIRVIDHLIFSNEGDALDPEAERVNVLKHEDYIHAEYGNYNAAIQFTNHLATGSAADAETRPFVLEKASLTGEWDAVKLELGDSYHEFGRGIALSLYRDDVFGINTTLQGASFSYNADRFKLKAIGGRIHTLSSPVALNPTPDPLGDFRQVYLAGGSADVHLNESTKIGAHYLLALQDPNEEKAERFDKTWNTIGATFSKEALFPDVDLYLESNALIQRRLALGGYENLPTGVGSFGALVWTPSPWQLKWEIKDYRDYNFEFRRPPSLELDLVETAHPENVWASRWQVDHRNILAKTHYYGAYQLGRDRFLNRNIHHGYFGSKFPVLKTAVELQGGYRSLPGHSDLIHATVLSKIKTLKRQSLEASFAKQRSTLGLDGSPFVEDRNKFSLTYTFSAKWSVTGGYEFVPTNDVELSRHFLNAGANYKSGPLSSRLFAGQTSGGTVCSGGVCRQVPPFTGAMFETTYSF